MTRGPIKDLSASVRARLLSLAQSRRQDYQRILGRYAIERLLYRLGRSKYRDKFVVKGATLFTLWTGQTHRPTKDLDLFGRGLSSAINEVEAIIREICSIREDDGHCFDADWVEGSRIKEDDEYDGVRVKFQADLAGARIPMRVDIGFGDAVYPEPELASFPVLLPIEAPLIRVYPREATIAEKFHAMVVLDIRNSRMKDSYDIWFMANAWEFEVEPLQKAIECSFKRRRTSVPEHIPFALTDGFLDDPQKKMQWNAFVNRLDAGEERPTLAEVGAILRSFLLQCTSKQSRREAGTHWNPRRHWH